MRKYIISILSVFNIYNASCDKVCNLPCVNLRLVCDYLGQDHPKLCEAKKGEGDCCEETIRAHFTKALMGTPNPVITRKLMEELKTAKAEVLLLPFSCFSQESFAIQTNIGESVKLSLTIYTTKAASRQTAEEMSNAKGKNLSEKVTLEEVIDSLELIDPNTGELYDEENLYLNHSIYKISPERISFQVSLIQVLKYRNLVSNFMISFSGPEILFPARHSLIEITLPRESYGSCPNIKDYDPILFFQKLSNFSELVLAEVSGPSNDWRAVKGKVNGLYEGIFGVLGPDKYLCFEVK